jgi:cell wall-associated NlpC family hydrolase
MQMPLRLYPLLPAMGLLFTLGMGKAKSETEATTPVTTLAPPLDHSTAAKPRVGHVATLSVGDLVEFSSVPQPVQKLLAAGLELTRENLYYKYGSDDPSAGGMDCSGTVYHLLQQAGLSDAPRDSSELYTWVWNQSRFQAVVSPNPNTFELKRLKPGDLLFWTGTYHVDRDPPVTHVMIYLGTNRLTGKRVMVGASEGRTFNQKPYDGVSVFDFMLPSQSSRHSDGSNSSISLGESRFIGYGSIPGLEATGTRAGTSAAPGLKGSL